MKKIHKYRILWAMYCVCTVPVIPVLILGYIMDKIRELIKNIYIPIKDEIIRKYKPKENRI